MVRNIANREVPEVAVAERMLAQLNLDPDAEETRPGIVEGAIAPRLIERLAEVAPREDDEDSVPVVISYRGDNDKAAKGCFFDHYVFQGITGRHTRILYPKNHDRTTVRSKLCSYVRGMTTNLSFGVKIEEGKFIPAGTAYLKFKNLGLLVIPGRIKGENDTVRGPHERKIIREALRRGQPILALCAGSWRLWESLQDRTFNPANPVNDVLVDAQGHSYSRMMSLGVHGNIVNNKEIHAIRVKPATLLASAMFGKNRPDQYKRFRVNSVHWKAVGEAYTPEQTIISARSKKSPNLNPRNRQGDMDPQDLPEAFEGEHGAPILGVQWHAEAYYKNTTTLAGTSNQKRLINYMVQAGEAYAAKRRMLDELLELAGA